LEALGINLGYLLVQILNFAILFVVLRKWVFTPIVNLLETRRENIAKGLEDARIAAEARENAEKDAEGILADAQQEASRIVKEATERAEQAATDIKSGAEGDAEEARKSAVGEAEQAKQEALGELRGQVASLAVAAAQKVIGEALDEKRQHSLIDSFFSGIEGGKVVLVEGQSLSGEDAEVTSALPLTDKEKETITRDIEGRMGSKPEVSFNVDPDILGGLVVRVGDKVIDGSVAGRLTELSHSLK
jgi:F-type H+-transporting ATPase subunit b